MYFSLMCQEDANTKKNKIKKIPQNKSTPPKPQANQHYKSLPVLCTVSTYFAGIWEWSPVHLKEGYFILKEQMPWVLSDSGILFYICSLVWEQKGSCNDWMSFIESFYENILTYFYSLLFVFSSAINREIEITSSHTICGQLKHCSVSLQTK